MPFFQNIGTTEIVILAIVILVFFGGKRLNEWAKGIGEAGHELKKAKKEFESSFNENVDQPEIKASAPAAPGGEKDEEVKK